jgi:hypothetical protein
MVLKLLPLYHLALATAHPSLLTLLLICSASPAAVLVGHVEREVVLVEPQREAVVDQLLQERRVHCWRAADEVDAVIRDDVKQARAIVFDGVVVSDKDDRIIDIYAGKEGLIKVPRFVVDLCERPAGIDESARRRQVAAAVGDGGAAVCIRRAHQQLGAHAVLLEDRAARGLDAADLVPSGAA